MKKPNLILLVIIFLTLQKNFAQDTNVLTGTLTLQQCVDFALKNNLLVKQNEFQMQSGYVTLQQAKGNMLPSFSAFINHGINEGRSIDPFTNGYINQNITFADYGLNAGLTLWSGSAVRNNAQQAQLSYEAGKMDLQQQKDNVTIAVILAYLLVLNNDEQLTAAKQQAEVTRKQAGRLELLNNDGAIAPATYYDMKGQLANDEMDVINMKSNLESAKLSLSQIMNMPYSSAMQLEKIGINAIPAVYDGTVDEIYQQALQRLAFVKAADLRKQSADKAVQAAKGLLYPTLSLNGSLGTNYSNAATRSLLAGTNDVATDNYVLLNSDKVPVYAPQNNYTIQKISYGDQWKNNLNSSVSIGLQIPILNGLQAKSRVSQAKIVQQQASFESNTSKIQLRQNIEQSYLNMTSAFDRYQELSSQVSDFSASFHSAEVRFDAGAITSVDYLIAKNNMDRATVNLIAAKYDYMLRIKILDFYQGKLTF